MIQEEVEQFSKLLVQNVRDNAIRTADIQLHTSNSGAPISKRWREAKESGDLNKYAESIIMDCVDKTIAQLLRAVDDGLLSLSIKKADGSEVTLSDDLIGELVGWYMGEWRFEYSSQRVPPDYNNLHL